MNEQNTNTDQVNVIFLFKDGRGEDNFTPKSEVFTKCYEAGLFGESPVNQVCCSGGGFRNCVLFKNAQGDQVKFEAIFAPFTDRIGKDVRNLSYHSCEQIMNCFGIEPRFGLDDKTIFINCLARDSGYTTVALNEAVNQYEGFAYPCIVLIDELDLVADPYRAFHYARPLIAAKIGGKYGETKKEYGFSHAAEQLLIGALNGAVDRDDRTEMAKLGLIFEAASALLKI